MEETTYNYEVKSLKREELLKEQIVEGYKNKLIEELLNAENPIVTEVAEPPKKSLWQRICSVL